MLEALVTILLFILFAGFLLRHFGKYLLRFFLRRMAKRFGADADVFEQRYKSSNAPQQEHPATTEPIIPDNVGEYVDYEEIPSTKQ
ncbi:MAG: DUF4834 family protein [Prevotellaceae bacterium]|jgi:hypothetical protein|nr:DUF4834 family protein [Prevotellaceae bacterium]